MKMYVILALLIGAFSAPVHAQYTCNDRAYLKAQLDKLNQTCGSGVLCSALGYKGSTAESAVKACVGAGNYSSTCSQRVTCEGLDLCSALGYKGSTMEDAVKACVGAGNYASTCSQRVTCEGAVQVCSALGYKGSTAEHAVKACVDAGNYNSTCSQRVECK